jgi:5'-methylthioinosine phosphorylase
MPDSIAIIVGSGFADLLDGVSPRTGVVTDYGRPSSPLYEVEFGGRPVLALARHGMPHAIPPHLINYRANLAALAEANVSSVIALNTVGVITDIAGPGGIAVPAQLLDYTWGREHTFVETLGEMSGHIDFTRPFAEPLRAGLLQAAGRASIHCADGGVYAATQGPRLETAAEVDRLERDGADYIGMTAMPEAALAAEIGIDYVCLALIVNHAAGRSDRPIHAELEAASGMAREKAKTVIEAFLEQHDGTAT